MLKCPDCGFCPAERARYNSRWAAPETYLDELDDFDILGAEDGCLVCPECGAAVNREPL